MESTTPSMDNSAQEVRRALAQIDNRFEKIAQDVKELRLEVKGDIQRLEDKVSRRFNQVEAKRGGHFK